MKKGITKGVSLFVAVIMIATLSFGALASDNSDMLYDIDPSTRDNSVPVVLWDWKDGVYHGSTAGVINQYTNTNRYFKPNSEGKIYYCIKGTSEANNPCWVETWCKSCGECITSFEFTPNASPFHRVVSTGNHSSHNIYFKIVVYKGGWFFSNNDFSGTLDVSDSYV